MRGKVYVAQCFAWWDDKRRRLEREFKSVAEVEPWYDLDTASHSRKHAIDKLLNGFAFVRWPELREIPRARVLRILRRRGWRVVRVRLVPAPAAKGAQRA